MFSTDTEHNIRVDFYLNVEIPSLHLFGKCMNTFRQKAAEWNLYFGHLNWIFFHPAKGKKIFHQAVESYYLLFDIFTPLVFAMIKIHSFGIGMDNGKRCFDLMTEVSKNTTVVLPAIRLPKIA